MPPDNAVIDNLVEKPREPRDAKKQGDAEREYVQRLRESMHESMIHMDRLGRQTAHLMTKFVGANTPHKVAYGSNAGQGYGFRDGNWGYGAGEAWNSGGEIWKDGAPTGVGGTSRPLNNLYLYASTLVPLLVMNNPMPEITSDTPDLRHIGWGLEQAESELYETINFDDIIRGAVFRCLFGLSVLRCGLSEMGHSVLDGDERLYSGQPFVENFGAERFRFDPRAKNFEDCRWMGHHYVLPKDYFLSSKAYKNAEEATANAFEGQARNHDPYEDQVALFDCWLPEGNPLTGDPAIITISTGGQEHIIHKIVAYDGDERGPYEIMSLTPIVDSVVPLPPANLWERLDEVINQVANKIHNQVQRQKDYTLFDRAANEDEVTAVRDANDGDMIPTSDPTRYNAVSMGGANNELMAALEVFRTQSNQQARNIDQLGGTGTTGDPTATEVATLQANANINIEDMIRSIHKPIDRIGKKMLWYIFNDPALDKKLSARDAAGRVVESRLTADNIEGEFVDYNFKHQLYSMQRMTPEKKVGNWMQLLGNVLLPLMPVMEAQGDSINVAELTGEISKLLQLPEIDRYFIAANPPPEQQQNAQPHAPQGQPRQNSTGIKPGQQFGRPQPKPAIQTNINAGQAPNAPIKAVGVGQGI